jgi:predicted ATPase with chaperone activity
MQPGPRGRKVAGNLKIARTVADLDRAPGLQPKHVSEAIQYRSLDRRGVG